MKKSKLSSVTALMLPYTALLLALWLLCTCFLTVLTARKIQNNWITIIDNSVFDRYHNIDMADNPLTSYDYNRYRGTLRENFTADARYNGEGARSAMVFLENGTLYLNNNCFGYVLAWDAADWYSGRAEAEMSRPDSMYTNMTVSELPAVRVDLNRFFQFAQPELTGPQGDGYYGSQGDDHFWRDADFLRFTGYYWDDNTFVPVSIATLENNVSSYAPGKTAGESDAAGALDWNVIYQTKQKCDNTELTEIYCDKILYYTNSAKFPYYRNDAELQYTLLYRWDNHSSSNGQIRMRLNDTVIIRTATQNSSNGTVYETRAAIGGNPLMIAAKKLTFVYILTFLTFVGLVILCRILLERRLEKPLAQIIDSARRNMAPISTPHPGKWEDVIMAQQGYIDAQQELQILRQENRQLKTALDYAENAESNRRLMVSNITHELKTPIAVIRSYCEGLQVGIAPEKQEKYLNVITEEADRIDTMVLEMLDLSRLEAGKVRLSQDSLDLLELTRGILDKLQPLLEVKDLSVCFSAEEASPLVGDEGRLAQVITNLTTNAIKYSPEGGKVTISVFQRNGFTHFAIENESPPLSDEALEKVWESFYRTEQSRTSKGTGLGLSICKAIIELHGGTCQVKNTFTGVEFCFFLPG